MGWGCRAEASRSFGAYVAVYPDSSALQAPAEKGERGPWNPEEKGRGASLNRDRVGHLRGPPGSCRLKHLRTRSLEREWGELFRSLLLSLLCRLSGDRATKKFPGLTLGPAVSNRSSLRRQFRAFSAAPARPPPGRRPRGRASVQAATWLRRGDTLVGGRACAPPPGAGGGEAASGDRGKDARSRGGRRFLGLCC